MNEIFAAGMIVSDSSIVHESAKAKYRNPLGAVACGTPVRIGLQINGLHYSGAVLNVLADGHVFEYEMRPEGEMLAASSSVPDHPCVLWYWFTVMLLDGSRIYYGTEFGGNSGVGKVYLNPPPAFQITVHDGQFRTPDWAKSAVIYQIFPDRFKRSAENRASAGLEVHRRMGRQDQWLHDKWNEPPAYLPAPGKPFYEPLDFFGGDLPGITEELPRLKALGATLLYLNPIFEAASNHRYNTGDYLKVDPILGTEEDFGRLIAEADSLGIRVILDGVFSHTGDDSVYFNRYGRYDSIGAYQSPDSPYHNWYRFSRFPDRYDSWWGFDTLPEVDENQPDWVDFVIEGAHSVFNTWLERGASGFRLDVADELPDHTIAKMRTALKAKNPESFLLGEVWEDATTKQSYNVPRQYALGHGLDSVMNYPFAEKTIRFLLGRINAYEYRAFLVGQSQNYPKEMYFVLMNLLSSHDIARIRTVLATGVQPGGLSREAQAAFTVTEEEDRRGEALQRLAAAIQFALPGIPSIYYGDEVGMHGLLDPFDRGPYEVCDPKMSATYAMFAKFRADNSVMCTGNALFYSTNGNILGILRYIVDGTDAFGNAAENRVVLTVVNPTEEVHRIVVDLYQEKECLPPASHELFRTMQWDCAVNLSDQTEREIKDGLLEIEVPMLRALQFDLRWTT
ncbi:MAG: glycoside hydrolase family 13 protein [Clostridiales Family XIII bacterium]|jgi:glycosidase|nr:glycoside hydrolase family 13 protein [Clostridiales Family XIII bacterium]